MDSTDSTAHADEFHTTHDWEGDASLTYTIVKAVAAAKDVEPTDLEPLQTALDPDALELLMSSSGGSASQEGEGRIQFTFDGCQVVVTSSGDVTARRHPKDGTHDVFSTESEFQVALSRLIREAEAAGIPVDGGWECRDESASRTWGIEIYEVDE